MTEQDIREMFKEAKEKTDKVSSLKEQANNLNREANRLSFEAEATERRAYEAALAFFRSAQ